MPTLTPESFFEAATLIAFALLSASLVLAFLRIVRGPSLPDRAVGLDLITTLALGFSGVYAITSDDFVFMDVCIAVALVGFLATVGFARYTERASNIDGDCDTDRGE